VKNFSYAERREEILGIVNGLNCQKPGKQQTKALVRFAQARKTGLKKEHRFERKKKEHLKERADRKRSGGITATWIGGRKPGTCGKKGRRGVGDTQLRWDNETSAPKRSTQATQDDQSTTKSVDRRARLIYGTQTATRHA